MRIQAVATVFLVLLISYFSSAQSPLSPRGPESFGMPQSAEGIALIEVSVVYPTEQATGEYINVRLDSINGGTVAERFTDSQGKAYFQNVRPGSYIIRVRGAKIEPAATEAIDIESGERFHSERIIVQIGDMSGQAPLGLANSSRSEIKIPAKAEKEFEKANESLSKGDTNGAVRHYRKAIEYYPQFIVAYNNLASLHSQSKDFSLARQELEKALKINPGDRRTITNFIRLNLLQQNYGQALSLAQLALVRNPDDTEFMLLMCKAQFLSRDFDGALATARRIYSSPHRDFEFAHIVAARALVAQNRSKEARTEYELLLKESPNTPEAAEARKALERLK